MSPFSAPLDLRTTREYRELGFQITNCPICGNETLSDHFICPNCGWEYDDTTEENTYSACNRSTPAAYRHKSI